MIDENFKRVQKVYSILARKVVVPPEKSDGGDEDDAAYLNWVAIDIVNILIKEGI